MVHVVVTDFAGGKSVHASTVTNSVTVSIQVIFIGHFGSELELAGIGLAVFFCNVTGPIRFVLKFAMAHP
jgi:fructose-1-phosphate kinase PfkB-like protein